MAVGLCVAKLVQAADVDALDIAYEPRQQGQADPSQDHMPVELQGTAVGRNGGGVERRGTSSRGGRHK